MPHGSLHRKLKRVLTQGVVMDIVKLQEAVRFNIGDVTFAEAYSRTGRIINITVSPGNAFERPLLLNYLTAPNVLVWSAASASCALPGLYESVQLKAKDQRGDVVLLDTYQCLHGRATFEGDREHGVIWATDEDYSPLLASLRQLNAKQNVLAIQNRNGCHETFAKAAADDALCVGPLGTKPTGTVSCPATRSCGNLCAENEKVVAHF